MHRAMGFVGAAVLGLLALTAAPPGDSHAIPATATQAASSLAERTTRARGKPRPVLFQSRITAGPSPVRDTRGRVWQGRPVGFGSWNENRALLGRDVRGTADDVLYQVTAWDVKWYRLEVPAAATYKVRLLMAESYWSKAGQRVFDVKAEGKLVASRVDIARAVGPGHAYDLTFPVVVRDGELTLDFVNRVDMSMVAAIEVTSTTPVPPMPARPSRRAVAFAPNSFWTENVSRARVASNSGAIVANLVRTVKDRYGGLGGFNAYEYNAAFYVAGAKQRRITVGFHDCQKKKRVPDGLFTKTRQFVGVPVPDNALSARGTDGAMSIYAPSTDQLWEFWQMRRNPSHGGWEACWGGRIDRVSEGQGQFPEWFGASASGLSIAGGMITLDDIRRGEINHVVALGVVEARAWPAVSWPARRTDGGTANPDVVMEGQRLRLDPTLNLDDYRMTPIGRMVAKAAQRYGFVVQDRSGVVGVGTESGRAIEARTGVNPWRTLLAGPSWTAMRNFPWHRLQALPKDYGRPGSVSR